MSDRLPKKDSQPRASTASQTRVQEEIKKGWLLYSLKIPLIMRYRTSPWNISSRKTSQRTFNVKLHR